MASPPDSRVKLSILAWTQATEWAPLQALGRTVEDLGFDGLWAIDHLYPMHGDVDGPIFEGFLTVAGWAAVTSRIPVGVMVAANTFRNPALVAKMATTLDHLSGGRMVLGLGAGWFEPEHVAYGIEFGPWVGSRLDWMDEAASIIRGMLDGTRPSGRRFYDAKDVINEPRPVQARLPLMIGGGGEKKTLATVARYADIWNTDGDVETLRRKNDVLRRWCDEVGRDESEIERTMGGGAVVVRRTTAEAAKTWAEIQRVNHWDGEPELVGTPDEVADRLAPYLPLGFHHIDFDFPAPFDEETLELLAAEVRPRLEAALT